MLQCCPVGVITLDGRQVGWGGWVGGVGRMGE